MTYSASYPTPEGYANQYPDTTERQSRTFYDRAQAQAWLAEEERLIAKGAWTPVAVREAQAKRKSMTFAQFADHYMSTHRNNDGSAITPGTLKRNLGILNNHLLPYFGNMRMVDITPKVVEQWKATTADTMADTPNARYNAYSLLSTMMHAAESEPIDDTGATLIERTPCRKSLPRPQKKHETVYVSDEQAHQLYDTIVNDYRRPDIALAMMIGLYEGMRIGEVLALRPCDIDLAKGTITVSGAVHDANELDPAKKREVVRGRTKNGKTRILYINRNIESLLADWIATHGKDVGSPLFPAPRAGGFLSENSFTNVWLKARLKVLGLEHLRFHDLRHNHETKVAREVGMVAAQREAGHTTIRSTETYMDAHNDDELKAFHRGDTGEIPVVEDTQGAPRRDADGSAGTTVFMGMPVDERAAVLEALPVDVAAHTIAMLPEAERMATLGAMGKESRVQVTAALLSE